MEWSLVVFLGIAMVSLVTFMGILIFGVKKTSEFKELQKMLDRKAKYLDSNTTELWRAFKESEEENGKLLERLKNLEAIVTSEAYETIVSGDELNDIQIHLEDEEPEELNDSDKAEKIAKRVR